MKKLPIAILGSLALFACSTDQESPLSAVDSSVEEVSTTESASVTINGGGFEAITEVYTSQEEVVPDVEEDGEEIDTVGVNAKVKFMWIRNEDSTRFMQLPIFELDDSTKVFPINVDCEKFDRAEEILIEFDSLMIDSLKAEFDSLKGYPVLMKKVKRGSLEMRKTKRYLHKYMSENITDEDMKRYEEIKDSLEIKKGECDSLKEEYEYEYKNEAADSLKEEYEYKNGNDTDTIEVVDVEEIIEE